MADSDEGADTVVPRSPQDSQEPAKDDDQKDVNGTLEGDIKGTYTEPSDDVSEDHRAHIQLARVTNFATKARLHGLAAEPVLADQRAHHQLAAVAKFAAQDRLRDLAAGTYTEPSDDMYRATPDRTPSFPLANFAPKGPTRSQSPLMLTLTEPSDDVSEGTERPSNLLRSYPQLRPQLTTATVANTPQRLAS